MSEVALLLGGNIGDTAALFCRAEQLLEQRVGRIVRRSERLTTPAWGFTAEAPFLNEAITIECPLTPHQLLAHTQQIEQELGRNYAAERQSKLISGERYTSRPIDIDIILWGALTLKSEELTIPHRQMCARKFVLDPLAQILPEAIHPIAGCTIKELANKIQ